MYNFMKFIKIGREGVCVLVYVGGYAGAICELISASVCIRVVGITVVNRFSNKEFSEYFLGPGQESKYVQVSVAFNTYPIQIFSTNYQQQTLAMDFVKRSFGSVLEGLNNKLKVMLLWSFWLIINNKEKIW